MELAQAVGAVVKFHEAERTLVVDASELTSSVLPAEIARRFRASVLFVPALLHRLGEATIEGVGGCSARRGSAPGRRDRLSRYGFQARQAQRYRDGRILLAGDAAHQFPATGIGINVGVLNAVNLAWKLAAVIGGWAPAGLLDTYHGERHFAGARALLQTQAQVALRRGQDPAAQALRELFLELLADEQPLRRIGALIAGTDIRYPMPGPGQHALAGTFAPDFTLHTDQGTTSVAELMHPARPVLLDLAGRPDLRGPPGTGGTTSTSTPPKPSPGQPTPS